VNPQAAVNGGNTFSGDFAGNCTDTVTGKTSPFGLTIDSTGRVGGQILGYVNGVGVMSTVIGSVTSPGVFNLTEYVNGSSIGTLSGSVSLNGSALTGTLTNNSSNSVSLSGSVVPQI